MGFLSEAFKNRLQQLAGVTENLQAQQNFYQNLQPKQAVEKAAVDYNFAIKQNNTAMANKIAGNLKSYLESQNYNWKQDPHAVEILSDFV